MQRLKIADIGYDPKYYPRVSGREDWVTVQRYKGALLANPKLAFGWSEDHPKAGFPPIHAVRATGFPSPYMLLDGLHRVRTYHAADYEEIPAIIERLPQTKWFERSVELNIRNSRPMDTGDRLYAAKRLEEDGMDFHSIAGILQMPPESLQKLMVERLVKIPVSELRKKTIPAGRGNREIGGANYGFLKAPFADQNTTPHNACEALAVQDPVAAGNVVQILRSAVAVLECGVDETDEEVVELVVELHRLSKR